MTPVWTAFFTGLVIGLCAGVILSFAVMLTIFNKKFDFDDELKDGRRE